jgi:hypothetical protein
MEVSSGQEKDDEWKIKNDVMGCEREREREREGIKST